jgi:hypothetical protein
MAKEKPNKWTREPGFLEANLSDIMVWTVSAIFLVLMAVGAYVVLFQPRIPGLSDAFSTPPPAKAGPPPDRKLHLVPGETEMKLFTTPSKKPPEPRK